MTWNRSLIAILGVSTLIEAGLAATGLVLRAWMLAQFGIAYTRDSSFLAFVIAWLLVLVTAICGYTTYCVVRRERAGWVLSKILGGWWVGIGCALYFKYGRVDNLVFDALKGLLLLLCAFKSGPREQPVLRG